MSRISTNESRAQHSIQLHGSGGSVDRRAGRRNRCAKKGICVIQIIWDVELSIRRAFSPLRL